MHRFGHTCKLLQLTLSTKLGFQINRLPLRYPRIATTNSPWHNKLILNHIWFWTEHKNVTAKWILIHNEREPDSRYSIATRPDRIAPPHRRKYLLLYFLCERIRFHLILLWFLCLVRRLSPSLFGVLLVLLCRLIFVAVILLIFVSFCANHHFLL